MRSFQYLAIFTIVKFNLVFSTLVDQDTNSDEEFEDIFYHQSSKELLCRNCKNKVLLFYFLLKNISGNQYSTCTLLDCIENEINWKWIYIKSPRYFHKIFAKKLWEINSVISILEFREINVFITELHYKLISRNFFQVCINFVFCHTTSHLV